MDSIELNDLKSLKSGIKEYQGSPFSGVAASYHENGELHLQIEFSEGRKHGLAKEFYASGSPLSESNFENGKQHGNFLSWKENGQIAKIEIYEKGKLI